MLQAEIRLVRKGPVLIRGWIFTLAPVSALLAMVTSSLELRRFWLTLWRLKGLNQLVAEILYVIRSIVVSRWIQSIHLTEWLDMVLRCHNLVCKRKSKRI